MSEGPDFTGVRISVIMPVYNGIGLIESSLPPLLAMVSRGEILEVIVVDDGSTDATVATARALGAAVHPSGGRMGPGGARNVAAELATGDILWFVDADVVVHESAVAILARAFGDLSVMAVFGSYDDRPPAQNFLSQYKNLVHHFYHQRAREEASTFWSGCGAIRKDAFTALGGFDTKMFTRPSVEDIELGYRLISQGGRVRFLNDLLCTHLKEWRLFGLLHTEIFCRALPWSRLMLRRGGITDDLNVAFDERVRALIAGVGLCLVLGSLVQLLPVYIGLVAAIVVLVANQEFLSFISRQKGPWFAIKAVLFHQVYYLYSGIAFTWALLEKKLGIQTKYS